MSIRFALAIGAFAYALGLASNSQAAISVTSQWGSGVQNTASDNNADFLVDIVSTVPGQVDVGDAFLAVVSFNTLELPGGGPTDGFFGVPGFNEWTGVALIEVATKTANVGGTFDFTFSAPSAATLAAASLTGASTAAVLAGFSPGVTTVRFFEDAVLNFSREGGTVDGDVGLSSDGASLFDIGFVAGGGGGPAGLFWSANDVISDNVGAFGPIPFPTPGGAFNFGQDLVPGTNTTGFLFGSVGTFDLVAGLAGTAQFGGTGSLLGISGVTTAFDAWSNTDMVFRPQAIPEPISLLVWVGLAMTLVVGLRRRN